MLDFEGLLCDPPALKSRTATLPDGREYTLYDLPASVLDRVYAMSREKTLPIREAAIVAAQSMLGRIPEEEEVTRMLDNLGADTILSLFRRALDVSGINDDTVGEAKKP